MVLFVPAYLVINTADYVWTNYRKNISQIRATFGSKQIKLVSRTTLEFFHRNSHNDYIRGIVLTRKDAAAHGVFYRSRTPLITNFSLRFIPIGGFHVSSRTPIDPYRSGWHMPGIMQSEAHCDVHSIVIEPKTFSFASGSGSKEIDIGIHPSALFVAHLIHLSLHRIQLGAVDAERTDRDQPNKNVNQQLKALDASGWQFVLGWLYLAVSGAALGIGQYAAIMATWSAPLRWGISLLCVPIWIVFAAYGWSIVLGF